MLYCNCSCTIIDYIYIYIVFIDFIQILIWYKFYRFYIISLLQFYRKRFFLQKKAPAGKCTHANFFYIFFWKEDPCGKMHTRQNIFKHFSRKKSPCGKMHTRQKKILQIVHFSRERNFYVLPIFTSDNYIFHREKQLLFVHNFLLTPQ